MATWRISTACDRALEAPTADDFLEVKSQRAKAEKATKSAGHGLKASIDDLQKHLTSVAAVTARAKKREAQQQEKQALSEFVKRLQKRLRTSRSRGGHLRQFSE